MYMQGAQMQADGGEEAHKSVLQFGQDLAQTVGFPEDQGYAAMRTWGLIRLVK